LNKRSGISPTAVPVAGLSASAGYWKLWTAMYDRAVFRLLILTTTLVPALSQEPRATIRVEVRTVSGPVAGAMVTLNNISLQTDQSGIAIAALPVGKVD